MKKSYIYTILLLTTIVFGAIIPQLSFPAADKGNTTPEKVTKVNLSNKEAVDLRNTSTFSIDSLNKRLSKCNKPWTPWNKLSKLDCTYTEKNLKSISLVADSANYIDNPLGKQNYSSKVYSTEQVPWDLEFLPNGSKIATYKKGELRIYVEKQWREIGELNVVDKNENGLLGLAVDPNFEKNRYVYLYYTYDRVNKSSENSFGSFPVKNRVSRFKLKSKLANEKILINEIPGSKYHSGGRLEFGPDGKLYASTGEAGAVVAEKEEKPQSKDFLGGKTLRINTDGTAPEDNPFNNSYVYSRGHRNPQGLAWNPENGDLYTTEHGSWREDEINHIVPGGNYGWAEIGCGEEHHSRHSEEVKKPVKCYKNWTMAPSGATFVHDKSSPWYGDMFVAGLRGKHIARLSIENNTITEEKVFYFSRSKELSQRFRDVEYFNESLWIIGDNEGMVKLYPEKDKNNFKSLIQLEDE